MTKPSTLVKSTQVAGVSVPNGAETIVCQVQISTDNPGAVVVLEAELDVTTGVGTTAATVQIRRGATTAGPVVGVAEVPAAGASTRVEIPVQVTDTPGEVASQVYSLTYSPTGATGAGTVNGASLQATY